MYALGLTIDVCTKDASGWCAFLAYFASLSRSGPIVPFVPAGVYVWQAPQPLAANACFPDTVAFGIAPMTFCGRGRTVPCLPHAATRRTSRADANRTTGLR